MFGNKVVVLGGTGFIGRAIVNELSKNGYETKVAARRPERFRDFALFPNTKVVALAGLEDQAALTSILKGADIVINLLADLTSGAEAVAVEQMVATHANLKKAIDAAGIKRVLSLSQIGANSNQDSNHWLHVLGESNSIIRTLAHAKLTVLRAGLLIGAGDETTSRYQKQLNRLPICPVPNADVVVQPLAIADFAKALVSQIHNEASFGQKLELVGEERLTLKELAELVKELMAKEDAVVFGMCGLNAKIMSMLGGLAPIQTASKVQLLTLAEDMISESDFETQFGFAPLSLEHVLSAYVTPHHIRERYNYYRREAGRDASELV